MTRPPKRLPTLITRSPSPFPRRHNWSVAESAGMTNLIDRIDAALQAIQIGSLDPVWKIAVHPDDLPDVLASYRVSTSGWKRITRIDTAFGWIEIVTEPLMPRGQLWIANQPPN
jgi:hypothetical protein